VNAERYVDIAHHAAIVCQHC